GYDLRPYLPALFNDIGPKTKDIRHDWGKTLTEIFNDYFISVFEKWAKQNGTKFRIQAYGTPPATLYSYAFADLGEGEGYTWKGFRETRWASSANHLLGRPITSSETWTWLHSPVFRASPLDVKAEADLHFLQGVNQMIGHGWPYSPPGIEYPGWRFYASMVFGESNPWWIVMPDLSKYLRRVSYMMRQGQPANDVALYLADSDVWAGFVPGRVPMNTAISRRLGKVVMRQILESGYNLDFFDDGLLDMRGKVEGGALTFGDLKYKVVVLPGVERIPPLTIRKLEEFAKGGGILIATRRIPSLAPGFKATDEDQKTVRETAERLFKDPGAPGIFLESDTGLGEALAKRLHPDVKVEPEAPKFGFVHRSTGSGEIYFVANTDYTPKNVKATFRVQAMSPEEWDPMTGRVAAIPVAKSDGNGVSVNLDLEPYSSQIIVFTKRALPAAKPAALAASSPQTIDLSHAWEVTFGKDKQPVMMDNLSSWTDNESTRYFSGVAVYKKKITVPAEMIKDGLAVQITFGRSEPKVPGESEDARPPLDIYEPPRERGDTAEGMRAPTRPGPRMQAFIDTPVREAAVVYVNGKRAGSVWCPPYSVDITGLLKSGENEISIEVANLALNYMADFKNHPLPDYKELNARFGDRFQPQNMDQIRPIPSGLLGPITIVAEKVK
ncbi:MAG: glycosyl hydrolase, partial [Thermoguttaceae bacterium]